MADPELLTLAFISAHPAQAARVLDGLPETDAAALFASLPARGGAPVFAAMLSPAAARVLATLEDETALALLTALGTQPAVAILRHVPETRRSRLIAGLPTTTAVASRLLLGYPDDTVGAWTDPDVLALPAHASAAEALVRLRASHDLQVPQLYVVGPQHELLGAVELHALLRVPEATRLTALMQRPAGVLAAAMALASALAHTGWEQAAALPVVERGERLLGVLPRATLIRALRGAAAPAPGPQPDTLIGLMARGYWEALSGIAEAVIGLLPAAKPIGSEKR